MPCAKDASNRLKLKSEMSREGREGGEGEFGLRREAKRHAAFMKPAICPEPQKRCRRSALPAQSKIISFQLSTFNFQPATGNR
jgi:hypothetical protein